MESATFFSMVEVFSRCFLMTVELDARLLGRRCVLKYSYLDTRNDPHDRPRRRLCTRASALAKIVFFVYICTVIVF